MKSTCKVYMKHRYFSQENISWTDQTEYVFFSFGCCISKDPLSENPGLYGDEYPDFPLSTRTYFVVLGEAVVPFLQKMNFDISTYPMDGWTMIASLP